ncbi:MAG: restriction endonuclease subunit S, partial [Tissierellia bacterium]|nr:restriction endonuclease subunit S [Tissierellia bacterium]
NVILKENGSCNQQINAILPSIYHSNEYLYYLLTFKTKYLLSFASKTATLMINKSVFSNIIINLPPLDEQKAISDILSKADEEIELLKELRDKKLEEKKGLMQLLLTGIIRV